MQVGKPVSWAVMVDPRGVLHSPEIITLNVQSSSMRNHILIKH